MITQDTRKNILQVLVALGSTVFSIAVVVCALIAGGYVFELTKGKNYSDVGVQMYSHSGRAALLFLTTYLSIIILIPIIISKMSRSKIFLYVYCVVNFFALMFTFFLFMMLLG